MKMRTVRHPLVLAALATVCGAAANAWTGRPGPRIPSLAGSRQGAVSVSDSSQKEASSAGLPAGVTAAVSIDGITQYNFSNGLRVLLIPDDSKATITVNITYLVGSRNEVYGETGMAHLLEHLMFKGTPAHPNIPDEMSAHGCSLGNTLESASGLSNGTTWFDRTNYYETFPATEDNLKWALELEADRMIHSFIARKDLDSEMTVVRNELESDENDPITVLKQRTRSAAYEWHNYSKDTIGARSDIENVPISRLQGFYHRYYQPDNAVLIVAGKFDAPKTLSAIDRAFGTIPRPSRELERSYTVEPAQDGEREATVRAVADTQALVLGYHIPAGSHRDMAAIEIFAGIVADPPSGRLFKLLNAHAEGAVVNNQVLFQHDPGMVFFSAQIGKESSFTETRGKMIETIEGMGAAPPTQEEVDRVRAAEESAIDSRFASTTAIGIWLSEWIALGDWRLFFVYRDSLKKVSPADVARVAKYYFQPSNRTVAALIPTDKPDRAEIPPTADIEAIANGYKGSGPAASEGEAFDPTPANIEARLITSDLPDGLKLALLPKKTRGSTVSATLTLNFGDAESLKNQVAPALLAEVLLFKGTTSHTAQQLSDKLNKLHAQVRPAVSGPWAFSVSIQTTRDHLSEVLELVSEMARHPSFPEDEFQKLKGLFATVVAAQRSQPAFITSLRSQIHFTPYAAADPRYPMTLDQVAAAFKSVTLEDVQSFHKNFYGASNSQLAVVGDFDPAEVKKQALTLFGDWRSPRAFTMLSTTFKSAPAASESFETPDKPGASFTAAVPLDLSQKDEGYPALVLANYMIGGGFLNSRLEKRIRGKEGLAYTVNSSLAVDPNEKGALFSINATCAPQNMAKLESAAREEMGRIVKEGFSSEEVEAAKKGYLESQTVNMANDSALAAILAGDMQLGRTIEWDATLSKQVAALTPDEVLNALRQYLDPAKLSVFKAGDFAKNPQK